jgi:hypothetical protein
MSMSARSNRDDLFLPSSRREGKEELKEERVVSSGRHDGAYANEGDSQDAGNPVQLEHMIGYGASNPQSVLTIPGTEMFIKRLTSSTLLLISCPMNVCYFAAWIDWYLWKI